MRVLHSLVEGGQTWAHRARMVKQVIKLTFFLSVFGALPFFCYKSLRLPPLLFQSAYYFLKAEGSTYLSSNGMLVSSSFWEKISHEQTHKSQRIIPIERVKQMTQPFVHTLLSYEKKLLLRSLNLFYFIFTALLLFFIARGIYSKKKKHVSGKKRRHYLLLHLQLTLTRKASDLKWGSLALVKGSETQHILVTGGTGTGKTTSFHHLLPQIRHRKQKMIIIDTTGAFIQKYYNPSQDIILNPLDPRGAPWHPWIECEEAFDYNNLAESLIPQTPNDYENYWRTAARTLLSSLLIKLQNTQKTSELTHWLLYEPLDRLAEFMQGTKAAAHLDIHSEKTAASIRSVAASFLTCLESLANTPTPFSIKKWMQTGLQESWLFLHAKPSQRATLNSLLSCWFSIGVRSLIQMNPDLSRRVWFVIDELPALHKLKELESLVTESRKYGGCALLALQSPAQLEEIYGRAAAQTIMGNCSTRLIFAEHDPEISERISRSLGECEVKEYQEGISYGAHEVRDGVNLSLQTRKVPTVSPTEIQSLENNQAFIKLPGNLPITKICFKLTLRKIL